jgi:hypothetical protein
LLLMIPVFCVFEKAKMIETNSNIVVDHWLCDSTQLICVVTNVITVLTFANKIAVSLSMASPGKVRTSKKEIWCCSKVTTVVLESSQHRRFRKFGFFDTISCYVQKFCTINSYTTHLTINRSS